MLPLLSLLTARERTALSLLTPDPATARDVYARWPPGGVRPVGPVLVDTLSSLAARGHCTRVAPGLFKRR